MDITRAIAELIAGRDLPGHAITEVFGQIMAGQATPAQIGGLLVAMRMKGETADEIAGAARAMRAHATAIDCPERESAVDTCGTGGDGSGTVNVSTMAAVVAAAAGARVAKHGNRALSSRSGSADVLEALGVAVDAPVPVVERCLREVGIGFLFAPAFHAATRHAAGPRRELGTRTVFNLLGPLTNPAQVGCQVVGVFDRSWCEPVARALGQLGSRRAFVVHGYGGLDEIAVRGATCLAEWTGSQVSVREIGPADFGLAESDPDGLRGGDPAFNAEAARRILAGESGAARNAVLMAAGAALCVTDIANDLRSGAEAAAAAIDSGQATRTLETWARLSQEPA